MSRISAAYLLSAVLMTPAAQAQDAAARLALDPAIRTGTLANGLTFFIRRNTQPEKRAALRLVVKAGSIDEAEDQRGLAHLVEHMAFNGSAHFKSGELVSYLESIGSRFGPDVNAYTSFDETVYMLEVPTDREGILTRGLEALSDFAGGIALEPVEIDRERGVVIEEWRGRQGAGTRMQAAQMEALFGDSRYADRLPIGLPDVLKSFPAARLREFYRDFYRADRMAVVAVGDFDPAEMEGLIRRHFDGLPAAAPAPRSTYPVPLQQETRYVAVSDREAQGSSVTVVLKRPLSMVRTAAEYRASVVRSLMHSMINGRFAEIARRPDAPFLRASSGESRLGRDVETFAVSARVGDGAIERGLAAIAQEFTRLRQYGFGEAELERAKKDLLAAYDRAFNERDKAQTGGFASELVRVFLDEEPAPGIAAELELVRTLVPGIAAADVSALVRALLTDDRRVVIASFPEKDGVRAATEGSLAEALRAGAAVPVEPWRDELAGRELLAVTPAPGTIRARREIPEVGVTVLTLSNGVEVWLKPTDFRNDQVAFTAYAHGGTSLAPEAEYLDASLSASLVGVAGIGGFTPVDLDKLLAGRLANAAPFMTTYTHGISGGSTPRDMETALQLVHLYFTAPNRDAAAFTLLARRLEASLANQAQSPGAAFGESVRRINTLDHYSVRPIRPEDVPRLNAGRMAAYYDARFRNAADFTFFFVGAFTVEAMAPLVETYLASLPSAGRAQSQAGNLRLHFPAAIGRETVRKGQEPSSQTAITFFSDTGLDEFESHRLRAATSVLQMRLRDVLREELSGTYSVSVSYADTAPLPGYGTTTVQFGSSPENAERLAGVVFSELDRLRREGPSETDVQAVKESEKRELETALRQNGYWLNSLQASHMLGRDPRRILQRVERAESLSRENIHEALRKYFPEDRYNRRDARAGGRRAGLLAVVGLYCRSAGIFNRGLFTQGVTSMRRSLFFWSLAAAVLVGLTFVAGSPFSAPTLQAQGPPDLEARHQRLLPLFELEGVVFTDADETRGRFVVGVRNRGLETSVRARLSALGIPSENVDVIQTEAIVQVATTLRSYVRPVVAGLQIRFSQYVCSLGFNAARNGVAGYVTAAHCSTKQGEVDGTRYYQPVNQVAEEFIGTEIADPAFSRGNGCPRGKKCRYSDANFSDGIDDIGSFAPGEIAKTTGANSGSLDIDGALRFRIKAEEAASVGQIANKVGRTTGWSQGPVSRTCVNTGVLGTNILLLCQNFVDARVDSGDSGSPVFRIDGGDDTVILLGVLWGGNSSGTQFVYSPIANVERELGALATCAAGYGGPGC